MSARGKRLIPSRPRVNAWLTYEDAILRENPESDASDLAGMLAEHGYFRTDCAISKRRQVLGLTIGRAEAAALKFAVTRERIEAARPTPLPSSPAARERGFIASLWNLAADLRFCTPAQRDRGIAEYRRWASTHERPQENGVGG